MPAVRKLTANEVQKIEAESVCSKVTMTPDMYRKCKEQNMARYTAVIDGTHTKGSR